jgi:FHA domain-containing protein/zinc ribbon family protein
VTVETLTTGTLAGTGSFQCADCGYVVTLNAHDPLPDCPGCGGAVFTRASLFATHFSGEPEHQSEEERERWLADAKAQLTEPGQYLAYEDGETLSVVPLTREWTRVGRSLAADIRFDDPTVSRRHALIVRQPDGVRVLDDRSLNGVFVNGDRVEWSALGDGDEIIVGRYRIHFIDAPAAAPGPFLRFSRGHEQPFETAE